ncbi:MAG: GDSL-type esterase/lipase family protein [Phenylobacterium sp.]|uniref:GDSL-type esterase/lipase family protein n=1 Tax=Phenylobacterium sp. TaxID=1871053 RepID=UPI0027337A26|nr:GDSL-type esterase/lipase family protein [Phenylobacterium sp.]MDP3749683.1 GDSL-type esterase/lipase family protein [Phenylobacterium sp.]
MRLIAFGDSMVAGAGDPDHLGWIGRALAGRRAVTLYNLGVRRETSDDIAARWRAEALPRITPDEPMRIVFSFGVNDCHLQDGRPRLSQAQSLKNAQAVLTDAAELCPVLLVGPPPVVDPGVCARLEGLNDALKALAARLRVPFIDVLRPLMADGLFQAEALAWDGAHPGAGGYQRMADLISVHPAWITFTLAD